MANENNQTPEQARAEQAREREIHLKHLREQKAVEDVFAASEVKFKVSPQEVLKTMGTLRFDADGIPVIEGTPLSEMLERVSKVNPVMVAGSWQEQHQPEAAIKSKADLKDAKDKADYVSKFGLGAFEKLPLQPVPELDESTFTAESFSKLPYHKKKPYLEKHGWDYAAKLKQRDAEQARLDRLVGKPVKKRP